MDKYRGIYGTACLHCSKVLNKPHFLRLNAPKGLISDRAKNFLSDIVAEINRLMGEDHRKTTPYHQLANGACKIRNKYHGNMPSQIVKEQHDDWDDLHFVQLAHNSSHH